MIDFCSLTSPSYPPVWSPDKKGGNKQTNKNLYTPQAYTSHSEAYEATEEALKLLTKQRRRRGVAETAGRWEGMLGIGVGFIIMVPVLYSSKSYQ